LNFQLINDGLFLPGADLFSALCGGDPVGADPDDPEGFGVEVVFGGGFEVSIVLFYPAVFSDDEGDDG